MRARYDFIAPTGTHFGIVKTIDERLAEIASPVDYWDALPARYTLLDGKVSEWTGQLGRKLAQANATRRPLPAGADGLALYDATANAAYNYLSLTGAQVGQVSALTIAFAAKLRTSAIVKDTQFIFGQGTAVDRLAYRYASATSRSYLRLTLASSNLDADLPSGHGGKVGAVITVSPTEVWLYVNGATGVRVAYTAGINLASLLVGTSTTAGGSWDGWIRRIGVWAKTATADEIATLQAWTA